MPANTLVNGNITEHFAEQNIYMHQCETENAQVEVGDHIPGFYLR